MFKWKPGKAVTSRITLPRGRRFFLWLFKFALRSVQPCSCKSLGTKNLGQLPKRRRSPSESQFWQRTRFPAPGGHSQQHWDLEAAASWGSAKLSEVILPGRQQQQRPNFILGTWKTFLQTSSSPGASLMLACSSFPRCFKRSLGVQVYILEKEVLNFPIGLL